MGNQRINPQSMFGRLDDGASQGISTNGRRTLYVSARTPWDANRDLAGGSELGPLARQALSNLQEAVESAGGTLADLVSLRIHVVGREPALAQVIAEAMREFFTDDAAPESTWVEMASLADPGLLIEIEAVAVLD